MSTLRVAQIRSKIKENGFRAQHFPRLRRAERGFAFGTVLVSPKSATLTVTIIPVSPEGGAAVPGFRTNATAQLSGGAHRVRS